MNKKSVIFLLGLIKYSEKKLSSFITNDSRVIKKENFKNPNLI